MTITFNLGELETSNPVALNCLLEEARERFGCDVRVNRCERVRSFRSVTCSMDFTDDDADRVVEWLDEQLPFSEPVVA